MVNGKVIKVVSDSYLAIYFLTENNGKYSIYSTNEERWRIFSKSEKFDDDSEYGNIDNIWWFKSNEFHQFIAVYNISVDDLVKLSNSVFPGEVK
ncbi:MAG: hypothetical protein GX270_00145 [Clostridiaceae bacterium]|nr:hypothetical protein [Clostridiaceae bacterium]